MMSTNHLGRYRSSARPSRRRVGRARTAQQERERALRRALDRDVVPRALPRSHRRRGHLALRLAHRRSDRRRAAGLALPRHSAVRHQPHQAAGPARAQPDRPPADREARTARRCAAPHQLLMMLDEFPALGRLDFFETSLAFMAGYGIRAFLIAQSLNQIEKRTASTIRSSTIATSASRSRPTTSAPPSAFRMRSAPRPSSARCATMPGTGSHPGSPMSWSAGRRPRAPADPRRGDAAARDRRAGPDLGARADPRAPSCAIMPMRTSPRASHPRRLSDGDLCRPAQASLERLGQFRAADRHAAGTRLDAEAGDEDGGMQQQRHPGIAEETASSRSSRTNSSCNSPTTMATALPKSAPWIRRAARAWSRAAMPSTKAAGATCCRGSER